MKKAEVNIFFKVIKQKRNYQLKINLGIKSSTETFQNIREKLTEHMSIILMKEISFPM